MAYYSYRATTDKLNDALDRIADAGDEVQLPLYHLGGRDWIIVAERAKGVVAQRPRQLNEWPGAS